MGVISGFKRLNKLLVKQFSRTVNLVLMFFVYFFVMGPVSIVAKIAGKRFLGESRSTTKESFWVKKTLPDKKKEDHYNMF